MEDNVPVLNKAQHFEMIQQFVRFMETVPNPYSKGFRLYRKLPEGDIQKIDYRELQHYIRDFIACDTKGLIRDLERMADQNLKNEAYLLREENKILRDAAEKIIAGYIAGKPSFETIHLVQQVLEKGK